MAFCSDCGYVLLDGVKFCSNCGVKVKESIANPTVEVKQLPKPTGSPFELSTTSKSYVQNTTLQTEQLLLLRKRLEFFGDKLLQINWRNRSIMLRRLYDKWCFDLSKLIIRNKKVGDKVVESALISKRPICLIRDSNDSELEVKDSLKLKSLYRNVTLIQRETGREETYFGFPFLVGHILEDTYVRGPLILFPVKIEHEKQEKAPGWYMVFSKEKKPILNRALLEAIRKVSQTSLSESFLNEFETLVEAFEQKNLESDLFKIKDNGTVLKVELLFLTELVKLLKNYNFPIEEIGPKLNDTQIIEPISSQDQLVIEKQKLHLVNYKVLGNFPQGDTAIYFDYEGLIKRVKDGEGNLGIIDNLVEVPSSEDVWNEGKETEEKSDFDLDAIPSQELNLVLDSDASQDAVIVESGLSACTVVRGPPGTGKSQVIANMISNAVSKGKKVLVVCQKRAALDVVFQRLDRAGLGKYVALIHDYYSDRANLYRSLSRILESKTDIINYSSNVNKLSNISREIDEIVKEQKSIVSSLGKEYFGGVSLRTLYTKARRDYKTRLNLSENLSKFGYNSLSEVIYKISTFELGCKKFDAISYPWTRRKSFADLTLSDKSVIDLLIKQIIESLEDKATIICGNESEQEQLINSLQILETQKGFFRRFKPNWMQAKLLVERIFKTDHFPDDDNKLRNSRAMSEKGLILWHLVTKYSNYMNSDAIDELTRLFISGEFDLLSKKFLDMKASLVDFEDIRAHDLKKMELTTDLRAILNQCSDILKNDSDWDKIVEQEFYHHWIRQIENDNPVLSKLPFETYLQNRTRLSELLTEQRKLNVLDIIYKIENKIVKPIKTSGRRKNLYTSELLLWSKIEDDLNKKRRTLPVRKLIEKYQEIVFKIAPCWLVSPEAVSSIFPLQKHLFDLIIFDEASQSAVERSLPSLYRGDHIVVLGDEKQLRPFDLFRIKDSEEEDYDEELVDESLLSESLLVLSKRIYSFRYLNWHYRSKNQELIDFSNYAFYDGNLQVAPNVTKSPLNPPIRWIQCNDGMWMDRKNIPEAHIVVEELGKILSSNNQGTRKLSVGVITFNDYQRDLILDEIEKKRRSDLKFDELYEEAENPGVNSLDDIPFVKNIENVQGDERDIIIFSVGYAKNEEGRLRTLFGSLNQEGGENRLNVAITRAREEVRVICSIDPNELNTEASKNDGPKRLKEYLKYAKQVSEKKDKQGDNILYSSKPVHSLVEKQKNSKSEGLFFDSVFEETVYDELRKLGYDLDTQVGNSSYKIDLAVVHPDNPSRYILAIECDGTTFQSAKSVKERDVMRQKFLESRGWTLERIWSRNWWQNPQREITRIQQRIEELRANSKLSTVET